MSEGENCGSCRFWAQKQMPMANGRTEIEYYMFGRCRKNPPSAQDGWPETWPSDWCGAFVKQKEKKQSVADLPPEIWLMACQRYARTSDWDYQLGPPPNKPGTRVPAEIWEEATKGQK